MQNNPQFWSAISHVSIALIALFNIIYTVYFFSYQKKKDREAELKREKLKTQNVTLSWFKELIIKPQWINVEKYFEKILNESEGFNQKDLSQSQKKEILEDIKHHTSNIRKSFVDTLQAVDKQLYEKVRNNMDNLIDGIAEDIFNEGINLNHRNTFEDKIHNKIIYSRNDLINLIFSYKGNQEA